MNDSTILIYSPVRAQLRAPARLHVEFARLRASFTFRTQVYSALHKRVVEGPPRCVMTKDGSFQSGLVWEVIKRWARLSAEPVDLYMGGQHRARFDRTSLNTLSATVAYLAPKQSLTRTLSCEYRDYQVEACDAVARYARCVLQLSVNAGKTAIAAMLAERYPHERVLLTVPYMRTSLAKQGHEMFARFGMPSALILAGEPLVSDRVVWASVPTLLKWLEQRPQATREWLSTFGVLIKDECHEHNDSELSLYDLMHNAFVRVGLSGTPFKGAALHDAATIGTFGPVRSRITTETLIDKGISVQPYVYIYTARHVAAHSTYDAFRLDVSTNSARNQEVVDLTLWLLAHGHRPIISVASVKHHARALLRLLLARGTRAAVYTGREDVSIRAAILAAFARGEIDVFIASRVLDVGISEDSISAIILAGPIGKESARVATIQKAGRGLRSGDSRKEGRLVIVDFQDAARFGIGQARARTQVWQGDSAFIVRASDTLAHIKQLIAADGNIKGTHDRLQTEAGAAPTAAALRNALIDRYLADSQALDS